MLAIATFNICNLGTDTPQQRLERIATAIAKELRGPDILAVQEIKGMAHADTRAGVPAEPTYRILIDAITMAGGPGYDFREIPPLPNHDGGQADSNIRVALLFNPQRVEFIDRGGAGPGDPTGIRMMDGHPSLTLSPGRIAPDHPAFEGDRERHWAPSRKALAGQLRFAGETIFVIVCHLKSMRSNNRREEDYAKRQRHAQARVIHHFVANLLVLDPNAPMIVLGDMNDVPGSKTLKILKGDILENLLDEVPRQHRYTSRHDGRPLALDHVLVSRHLSHGSRVAIHHLGSDNTDPQRASDHDPVLAMLDIRQTHAVSPGRTNES